MTFFPSIFLRAKGMFFVIAISLLWAIPAVRAQAVFTSSVYGGAHKVHAIDTAHFTLEFSEALASGSDTDRDGVPDVAEAIADYAEISWTKEVDELKFPNPIVNYAAFRPDAPQDRIFLILDDAGFYLEENSLGVTSLGPEWELYMAVDPTLSDDLLKVTVAHEFAHVVQFSYQGDFIGYDQDLNFAEQTAVAVEDFVFDDVNDYRNYLRHYFTYPDYSILTGVVPEDTLFEYALALWPRFLIEYFDDWTVLPKVVQAYFEEPVPDVWDSFEAYLKVVEEEYDMDLREVYQDFTLWNYLVDFYEEGADYPSVVPEISYGPESYPLAPQSIPDEYLPALYGTNYLQFEVSSLEEGRDFRLTFDKPADVDLGVMVLPESETEYLIEQGRATIFEAGFTTGQFTTPIRDGVRVFTVMVSPLSKTPSSVESPEDAFSVGYPYTYSATIGSFLEGDETEFEQFSNGSLEEVQSLKEGQDFGTNLPEAGTDLSALDSLTVPELAVSSYDATSVSLRWSRPSGADIAGYRVYYRFEGDYFLFDDAVHALSDDVNGAHITHLTFPFKGGNSWWPSGDYYFTVKGIDAEGNESAMFSNEVGVRYQEGEGVFPLTDSGKEPDQEEFIVKEFPDVPPSHRHHDAISFLTALEVFQGYADGTFKPNQSINRAELMKILSFGEYMEDEDQYRDCFPDVKDEWFAPYVCYGAEQGWVQGYADGLFHPERIVTRAEALKMIYASAADALDVFNVSTRGVSTRGVSTRDLPYTDVYGSAWYAPYIVQAHKDGLLESSSGGVFGPDLGQSRSQVAEIIYRTVVVIAYEKPFTPELEEQFLKDWAETTFFPGGVSCGPQGCGRYEAKRKRS